MQQDKNSVNPAGQEKSDPYQTLPDQTPRREGGDDALAKRTQTDSRADEKVIVNDQRQDKVTNGVLQATPGAIGNRENDGTDRSNA